MSGRQQAALLLLLLAALAGALLPSAAADAAADKVELSLIDLAESYWTPTGIRLPSPELVAAITQAKLPVRDAAGNRREIVIMTIGSEFAFQKMFTIFLKSLADITFLRANGTEDHLARHVVIGVMTTMSMPTCAAVADPFGAYCVSCANPAFSAGNFHVHSNEFFGIGFSKTAAILDALTLGVDVLFLDADQVFFKNPLPYLLEREIDIMVSGDCHNHGDSVPMQTLPPINNNIGFVYFRPTAMVTRSIYNWALHLANIARRNDKPWDQTTFAGAIEWTSNDVTVRHISMAMLHPDRFPYMCMGPCGCDLRDVPYFHIGKIVYMPPEGHCPIELMEEWYNYHFPCAGDMNTKAGHMQWYTDMYIKYIGPVNSRSAPFDAL